MSESIPLDTHTWGLSEYEASLRGILHKVFGGKDMAKRMAIAARASPRTTEKWIADTTPSKVNFFELCVQSKEFQMELNAMVEKCRAEREAKTRK